MTAQARKTISITGVLAIIVAVGSAMAYLMPALLFPTTVAGHTEDIKTLKEEVSTLKILSARTIEKVDNTDKRTERIENKLDKYIFGNHQ